MNLEGVEQSARCNDMKQLMKLLIALVLMNELYSVGRTQFLDVIITSVWWSKSLWKALKETSLLGNKPVIVIRLGFTDRCQRKIVAWSSFCFVLGFLPCLPCFTRVTTSFTVKLIHKQPRIINSVFYPKETRSKENLTANINNEVSTSRAELLAIETRVTPAI